MRMSPKAYLLCGVSALAITAVLPLSAQAADMPVKAAYRGPPVAVSPWTFWLEGGAQAVSGGDSAIGGLTPSFTPEKKTWGWSGAAALDYRFDPFWHVSAGFRYGANKSRTTNSNQNHNLLVPTNESSTTTAAASTNSATRKESNWVADFMVGRDLGLGAGTSQVKFGLRVASIRGTTDGSGATGSGSVAYAYSQTSKWTGFGPRLAIEGNVPLTGPWSLDYMGGVAGLFGKQQVDQTATTTLTGAVIACLSGCPATGSSSSNNVVFNADGMLGIAYAINPNNKIALNYRVDYYANAMRVIDSAGNASNTNRTYHGPNLRWTTKF